MIFTSRQISLGHSLLSLAILLAGCAEPTKVESAATATTCPPTVALVEDEEAEDVGQKPKAVTFYGDLLPILASVESGKVYKCTTCHAHYAKPKSMNNVEELERVVESMRSGRMPRGGTPVPNEKIELFSMWRIQGFQEGSPRKPAAQADATPNVQGVCP